MKKFLLQLFTLTAISLTGIYLILWSANGYTDAFYIRFTTPIQENMVLGTSRAAQGFQPHIFKEISGVDIYNYAFTVSQSPYGRVYFESIKKKLKTDTKNGIFIITVDPWSISSNTENPNNHELFRENNLCVANTSQVDVNPNIEYLLKNLSGKYYEIPLRNLFQKKASTFLHKDGWLEINVTMNPKIQQSRIESKIQDYRKNASRYSFSSYRFDYLKKTIDLLKAHGDVYLVRLPVHEDMLAIENTLMPDFTKRINEISQITSGYLDMTSKNSQFEYTDGNHLYKTSGARVTEIITKWVLEPR